MDEDDHCIRNFGQAVLAEQAIQALHEVSISYL